MNDLLSGYAQGLADYQVIISACLIVFVFFAIGRDISRSLGRVEDELAKIVAAMKQGATRLGGYRSNPSARVGKD